MRRRQVAHLGEGEEALVLRVLAGHAAEEVDVLGRREPLDVEALEAPEVEPLADHRVEAAVELVLDEPALAGAEGEVLHAPHAEAGAGAREGDDDADDARTEKPTPSTTAFSSAAPSRRRRRGARSATSRRR